MSTLLKQSDYQFTVSRRIALAPHTRKTYQAMNMEDVRKYLLENHQELLQRSLFERSERKEVEKAVRDYLNQHGYFGSLLEQYTASVTQEICGLGPIDDLFFNPEVTDIMVNRHNDIWVMRAGKRREEKVPLSFEDEDHVYRIASKIAHASGQQLSLTNPMPVCYLPGARVSIVIPPISQTGTTITIRKYSNRLIPFEEMIEQGMVTREALLFLQQAMESGLNMVLAGPVGSGKTTFLRNLVQFIPDTERILVIESVPELRLSDYYPEKHVVSYTTRESFNKECHVDLDALFERSLSQNMRRFIFGEIRGKETMTVMEALNTGHKGMTTMHGNSAADAVERMIMMCLRTERDISPEYTGKMIARSVDVVVHMKDLKIMEIAEVVDYQNGRTVLRQLFHRAAEQLEAVREPSQDLQEQMESGTRQDAAIRHIDERG